MNASRPKPSWLLDTDKTFEVVGGPSIEQIETVLSYLALSSPPENPEPLRFVIEGGFAIECPLDTETISQIGALWHFSYVGISGKFNVWIHDYDPTTGSAWGVIR